ncbi:MAG TPA: MarR family winged helix-turn-helix transcriptional regulator [Candidatus Limnocylindrales bacterium]|nr:MarR family winged helix-turn-helix transcriptional regulator [Candidatus Limnocylindrales bacterium]
MTSRTPSVTSEEAAPTPSGRPGPVDPRLRPWIAFLRAHAAVTRRLEAELQEDQALSLADYDALLQLTRAEAGRLRMNELADRLLLTRSGVSRLVDRLALDGYVTRARCSSDARGAYAVITPLGRSRLDDAAPTHLRGIAEHFLAGLEPLPGAEREAFTHVLERILARLEGKARGREVDNSGPPPESRGQPPLTRRAGPG